MMTIKLLDNAAYLLELSITQHIEPQFQELNICKFIWINKHVYGTFFKSTHAKQASFKEFLTVVHNSMLDSIAFLGAKPGVCYVRNCKVKQE